MTPNRIKKIIIIVTALTAICINLSYGIGLLSNFLDTTQSNAMKDILISAIALEFGWTALLLWALFKPFERRYLLLFTALTILLGNLLHSYKQYAYTESTVGTILPNLGAGILFTGLFVAVFVFCKPDDTCKESV